MEPVSIPLGGLVQHAFRPGVWRVVGFERGPDPDGDTMIVIEPWDDLAAGSFHPAEAYSLPASSRLIRRLQPGRSINEDQGRQQVPDDHGARALLTIA